MSKENRNSIYREWAENTTCHGVPDLNRSKHILSVIFWATLLILLFAAAFTQIAFVIKNFVTPPFYQKVLYTKNQRSIKFPNVTICNFNRANKTKTTELRLNNEALSFLYMGMQNIPDIGSFMYDGTIEEDPKSSNQSQKILVSQSTAWLNWYNDTSIDDQYKNIDTLLRYLGHECEDSLISCTWAGVSFDCCEAATPILNGQHGLCWSITPPFPGDVLPGKLAALKIMIDPKIDLYQPETIFNDYLDEGIVLSTSFDPYEPYFEKPIYVSPGRHASVALSKIDSQFSDPDFKIFDKDCTEQTELLYGRGKYTQHSCQYECVLEEQINNCDCMFVGEFKDHIRPTCLPQQLVHCYLLKVFRQLVTTNLTPPMLECLQNCQVPCGKRDLVSSSGSISDYPAKSKLDHMLKTVNFLFGKNMTKEELAKIIQLDIFYSSTEITVAETTEVTSFFNLIGNMGGHLGICLGISVLTLVQAVYYLFYGAKLSYDRRSNRVATKPKMKFWKNNDTFENSKQMQEFPSQPDRESIYS